MALKIINGLADGTLVPDPPLAPDPPLDFDADKKATARIDADDGFAQLWPLDDRILVEPLTTDDDASGGIILLDSANLKPQRGRVLAVGSGKLLKNGQRIPIGFAQGDKVVYGKYAGADVKIDGNDIKVLHESDILAKFVK